MLVKKNKNNKQSKKYFSKKEFANGEGFISLSQATKLCSYSQEYLSLLTRRGELKGKKFGRNWFTKKSWLEEYILKHPVDKKGNIKGELFEETGFRYLVSNSTINKNIFELIRNLQT